MSTSQIRKIPSLVKFFNSKVKELEEHLVEGGWYIFNGSMNYDKNGNLFFKIDSATEIPFA